VNKTLIVLCNEQETGGMAIDECRPEANQGCKTAAQLNGIGDGSTRRQRLRTRIVSRGIQMVYGSADVSPEAAADISLVSAAARFAWQKALGAVGVKSFVTTSAMGYDFVCHTGDLASYPFYYRRAYQSELQLCAGWLQEEHRPVVYDVGANDGFLSTHLAQMLSGAMPRIYAFEPVPTTFAKLVQSVNRLELHGSVHPVPAAVVDRPGSVRISYSERNSLEAQVTPRGLNLRVGDRIALAKAITLDGFCSSAGVFPSLVKIDVEGSEVAVLRGARGLLSRPDRPAILFEYNPVTLQECGESARTLLNLLPGYSLHYVDDLRRQQIPFGRPIHDVEHIDWICNLFAVPPGECSARRWASVLKRSARRPEGQSVNNVGDGA
jgi:FkbM family methyltransferase